jgi:hypothetical protein
MNFQIWRKDKEVMLYINPIADKLLDSMDGLSVFSDIVERAYDSKIGQIKGSKTLDLVNFSILAEYGDRLINSAAFTMALWAKGFIQFTFKNQNKSKEIPEDIFLDLANDDQTIISKSVLLQLFEQYPDNLDMVIKKFHKIQGYLMGLLMNDKLMALSICDKETDDKPAALFDTPSPQFEYGYVKPAILEKYGGSFARIGAAAGCAAAIIAIVGGTLVAFYVGDKTVSQECGTGDDPGDGSNDGSQPGSGDDSGDGDG